MPQMAPLNWTLLYIYFILIFLLIVILNYYMFLYKPSIKITKKKIHSINWKW
uniref:ATP synthase complex subunit 8 n=1 Tax=Curculionidae sp. KM-2017 TaxID=2219391 RepID=A0A346RFQ7_9CUCU|nr:ATP synthase F0 subunit 8 [Curculionidae sp. KM-2017]